MKALDGKKKSHRFRSHSSIARCASDPVCGGTSRAAGVPSAERNATVGQCSSGHCCNGRDGQADVTVLSPHRRGDVFCAVPYISYSTLHYETIGVPCD